MGAAIDTSVMMMKITIINSTSVKPRGCCLLRIMFKSYSLPVTVLGPVQRGTLGLAGDIENILAAPGSGFRIILHGAQVPLGFAGHGVRWDSPQESHFLASNINAIHQRLQIRRIILAAHFGA